MGQGRIMVNLQKLNIDLQNLYIPLKPGLQ